MTPDQIRVGQVLAGKGSDCDKTRKVVEIDARRTQAVTDVYRLADGQLLGRQTLYLSTLARWADRIITTAKETT